MKQAPSTAPRSRGLSRTLGRTAVLAACVTLAAALPAAAQSFEIVPTVGYRFGGDFDTFDLDGDEFVDLFGLSVEDGASFGLTVDFRLGEALYLEVLASRQDTSLSEDGLFLAEPERLFDLDVDYLHAGVMYRWSPGQAQPYVALTGGVTRFGPQPSDLGDETRPSIAFGGGVQLMFSSNVGLRLDGRLFATFVDRDEDVFCNRRACYRFDSSTYFYQGQASAGLVISF